MSRPMTADPLTAEERLRKQNHDHAALRDRQMATLQSQVDRYRNAYERARELVRGSPVDWTNDPGSRKADGWWNYTSQNNRDVLMAATLDAAREELGLRDGAGRIAAERRRQIEVEGWTADHDADLDTAWDDHLSGQLAIAAACYALPHDTTAPDAWPWREEWWKPTPGNRIRELEKAGALLAAEIDRLAALRSTPSEEPG